MDAMNVTREKWTTTREDGLDGEGPRVEVRIAYCDGCDSRGVVCSTPEGEVEYDGGRLASMAVAIRTDPRGLVILCAGRSDGSELHRTLCEECAA